jgi:hypothetical protein
VHIHRTLLPDLGMFVGKRDAICVCLCVYVCMYVCCAMVVRAASPSMQTHTYTHTCVCSICAVKCVYPAHFVSDFGMFFWYRIEVQSVYMCVYVCVQQGGLYVCMCVCVCVWMFVYVCVQ